MAKLYLTFDGRPLKEFTLSHGVITIGRLPDNLVQIDNLAVSGHHAKVYWEGEHYMLEDTGSTNGTYVNETRVGKHTLTDGDKILIGKHTLEFADEWHEDGDPAHEQTQVTPPVPQMQATVMLDTKKAKELLAQAKATAGAVAQTEAAAAASSPAPHAGVAGTMHTPAPVLKEQIGVLTVVDGKTDEKSYTLTSKLTMIGKNQMATIRLKGWFAPDVAASITRRDSGYFIAAQDKGAKLKVAGADVAPGSQKDLHEGDTVEVAGVKMTFSFEA